MTLFGETGQDLSAGGETVRTALMNNMSSLSSVSDQVLGVRFVEGSFATTDTSGSTDPNSGGDGNDNNGGGGLPVFAYVLIGAGTLVLLIIILVVVLLRRNRRSDESTGYGKGEFADTQGEDYQTPTGFSMPPTPQDHQDAAVYPNMTPGMGAPGMGAPGMGAPGGRQVTPTPA